MADFKGLVFSFKFTEALTTCAKELKKEPNPNSRLTYISLQSNVRAEQIEDPTFCQCGYWLPEEGNGALQCHGKRLTFVVVEDQNQTEMWKRVH